MNSFQENFAHRDIDAPKLATYRLWAGTSPDALKEITDATGDGKWGQLHNTYFLAEGDDMRLNAVFSDIEKDYGKPVFGEKGKKLARNVDESLSGDLVKSLQNLPRAEKVKPVMPAQPPTQPEPMPNS